MTYFEADVADLADALRAPPVQCKTLKCKYGFGDRLQIDSDGTIVGVVVSIEWRRPDVVRYELSWFHQGNVQFAVFDEWRLAPA